jgi:hypothetical protein
MKKSVPQLAIIIGVTMLFLSLVWWQQTFGIGVDNIKCLALSGGKCRAGSLVKIFGGAGYSPFTFWIALICLSAGILLNKLKLM